MKRFEAKTLEEAYEKIRKYFNCSLTEIEAEVIQYPKKGFLGLFAKPAIIEAKLKDNISQEEPILEQKEEIEDKEITNESNDIQEEVDTPEIIVDSFFKSDIEPKSQKKSNNQFTSLRSEPKEVQKVIQEKLKNLLDSSCFDVDRIEVEIKDSVAHIFIDGNDAALLIGKEGYRYNALSYLLFNWINQEFGLFVKLEIAQFLQNQQEMIKALLKPIIENIKQEGYGKTPTFDGVLAQLVLEELRREFPNKYVAIKRNKEGEKYIIVNEFNKPNE